MKRLFEVVNKLAHDEIEKFGAPSLTNYGIAQKKGVELAKNLGADVELVKLGCALMDIKLGECFKEKCPPEHIKRGMVYSQKIFEENHVDAETKKILLNCVEAHHGGAKYETLEAEICANADCYRFIHPRGVIASVQNAMAIGQSYDGALSFVLAKMEEKHNILSLDICKKELEPYYQTMKKMLEEAIKL